MLTLSFTGKSVVVSKRIVGVKIYVKEIKLILRAGAHQFIFYALYKSHTLFQV